MGNLSKPIIRKRKRDSNSYTISATKEIVCAGDFVLMKGPDRKTYVARVEKFDTGMKGDSMVKVRWYYKPEQTDAGRREFHGIKEVFLSDQYGTCSAHAIIGKCIVHTFEDYVQLKDEGAKDYYSRFEYNTGTKEFTPEMVEVFCNCEMPSNPDAWVIVCDDCKQCFHPRCVNLTIAQAKQLSNYLCDECSP